VGIICTMFAITNRIVFTTFYSTISRDARVQLSYAENLLAGKGMGVTKYFTSGLQQPFFDKTLQFPPGFSLGIIPFLKLAGGNEYNAVLSFQIFAAALFVLAVRYLGRKAGLSPMLNNFMILVAGCSQYPFFSAGSPTDVISLALLLFAAGLTTGIILNKKNLSIGRSFLFSLFFFLPAFFRYIYLPVTLLLPLLVFFSGKISGNKQSIINGKRLTLTSAFLMALFFISSYYLQGSVLHIYNTGRGLFPGQLVHWYPFLPASFINLDFAVQQVSGFTGLEYNRIFYVMEILNVILFISLLLLAIRLMMKHQKNWPSTGHSVLLVAGSLVSITIILVLAYLSLTYRFQDWGEVKWTYSHDNRYFAFIYLFIPLVFFLVINYYDIVLKKTLSRILVFILFLFLFTETAHGVYYNIKILAGSGDLGYVRDRDKDYRLFPRLLEKLKNENPGRQILVCGPDQYYPHQASVMGYKAIFDYQNLNNRIIKPGVKSLLVVPVHSQDSWIMKEWVERNKPRVADAVAGTVFYAEKINP